MKRIKYADVRTKDFANKREFTYKEKNTKEFDGYISLLTIVEAKEKWFVPREDGSQDCLVDDGYKWLSIYPNNKKYAMTVIFTNKNEAVEVYFDMIRENGFDGTPWIDDVYLDLVYTKNREEYILDEDEILEALETDKITKDDFDTAYKTLDYLRETYGNKENFEKLLDFSYNCLEELEKN